MSIKDGSRTDVQTTDAAQGDSPDIGDAPAGVTKGIWAYRPQHLGFLTSLLKSRGLGLLSISLFLIGWWLLTSGLEVIRPLFYPSPESVVEAAWRLRSSMIDHVIATMSRVLAGLTIGAVAGVMVGLAMMSSRIIFGLLDPQIESLRPVPPIAVIPFFILWFGLAEYGKVLLVSLAVFMIMVVATVEAIRNVSPIYIRAAETLGASRGLIRRRVVAPAILPSLVGGLRISTAAAFAVDIAAEFMGAQSGLGYLIISARRTLSTDVILLAIIIIGLLSASLDTAIRVGARRATRWSERRAD